MEIFNFSEPPSEAQLETVSILARNAVKSRIRTTRKPLDNPISTGVFDAATGKVALYNSAGGYKTSQVPNVSTLTNQYGEPV